MADIAVTARLVRPLGGAVVRELDAGGSGSVGDLVYINSSGVAVQSAGGAAGTANAIGVVVNSGSQGKTTFASGDRLAVVLSGPVAGWAAMVPGANHFVSNTAGKLGDAAGTVSKIVGVAEAADVLIVRLQA